MSRCGLSGRNLTRAWARGDVAGYLFAGKGAAVPGDSLPVDLSDGTTITHSIAEIAQHHAVRVAAVSLCDDPFLGFCADPAIAHDLDSMAAASERDAAKLIAAA